MARKPLPDPSPDRRQRGFEPAFGLMAATLRRAGEGRGFAVARLLTHWAEVAGPDLAAKTRPVKIGYGRQGLGASLTLLVRASEAPVVQMQLPALKDRVNAVYGYAAIAHIHLTQTAAMGFAEGQAEFTPAPKTASNPDPRLQAQVRQKTEGISDTGLRMALEQLAQNILTRCRK